MTIDQAYQPLRDALKASHQTSEVVYARGLGFVLNHTDLDGRWSYVHPSENGGTRWQIFRNGRPVGTVADAVALVATRKTP